jgi:peptidyl-tRNA hydrolase, PTH1 family
MVLDHLEQTGYSGLAEPSGTGSATPGTRTPGTNTPGTAVPGTGTWKEKFHGLFLRVGSLVLIRPMTHMNESGRSVQAAMGFFGVESESVLVVHDDLETRFGSVQLCFGGGHRGNNGVRSIAQHCGGSGFWRLRIGIGRPPATRSPADWVLERFSADEEARVSELCAQAATLLGAAILRPREMNHSLP